jgi:hypothetical protein
MKKKGLNLFNWFKRHKKMSVFLLFIIIFPSISFAIDGLVDTAVNSIFYIVYSVLHFILEFVQFISIHILIFSASLLDNFLYMSISPILYDMDWIKMG